MAEKVRTFEDLAVYQKARALVKEVYRVSRVGRFAKDFGLVDQVRRAAVSIVSNIAEGFERGGNAELIQFLYVAKGSCGEVRAQLTVAADQEYIDAETFGRMAEECRRVGGMLSNLIGYLRRSSMKGEKYSPPKVSKEHREMLEKYRSRPAEARSEDLEL
jgi:four helix bundle protein